VKQASGQVSVGVVDLCVPQRVRPGLVRSVSVSGTITYVSSLFLARGTFTYVSSLFLARGTFTYVSTLFLARGTFTYVSSLFLARGTFTFVRALPSNRMLFI
jgi:hypothetical protein